MKASPLLALARRALADARVRELSFAALFALLAYSTVKGYRTDYPTLADRLSFARAFAGNAGVRLFYGKPLDLLTAGGFAAWRAGGFLAILAGVWGVLAGVRALRGEEESGRSELVLAEPLTRLQAYASVLAGAGAGAVAIWLALLLGLLAGALPAGPSAYLALATLAPAGVFLGVGALASQLASTRRLALELSYGALLLALVVRVVADTTSLQWLRWLTPLGWSEQMRAFDGERPLVLALPIACTLLLLALAGWLARRRDLGTGLLGDRDDAPAGGAAPSSMSAFTLGEERASFVGWLLGSCFFALIIGVVSKSVSAAGVPGTVEHELKRLGGLSILNPSGYISLCFLFFVLAISLYSCSQLAAARHEEAQGLLETLLALPLSRRRWFGARIALALAGVIALSLGTGALAWVGAAAAGAHVSFGGMIEAGANCVPAALLFLAIAALAFALAPRASTALSYGLVALAFTWQLVSALLGAPAVLRELSPFEHVGLVPAAAFDASGALAMLALAALGLALALWAFGRRDLVEA